MEKFFKSLTKAKLIEILIDVCSDGEIFKQVLRKETSIIKDLLKMQNP